jgi:hypothetical protein
MRKRVLLAIGLLLLQLWIGCSQCEQRGQDFETGAEAREAGAIGSDKWIPPIVPDEALEVREVHHFDTGRTWVTFRAPMSTLKELSAYCHDPAPSELELPRSGPDWWSPMLTSDSYVEDTYQLKACSDGGVVAIDANSELVFYWHSGVNRWRKARQGDSK